MNRPLEGIRVAILVTQGFEQVEMTQPRETLEQAGARVTLVSPMQDTVRAWDHTNWGDTFDVDLPLSQADPAQFDALVLPGGVMNPDKLRMDEDAIRFVRAFTDHGKPVGVICHGPWTLIEANAVRGRTITSYPSLKTDLTNAGAIWVDEEVVTDGNITSSRNPGDLDAFGKRLISEFSAKARAAGR